MHSTSNGIPPRAGIGLRAPHYHELLERLPDIGWLEVHSENYFGGGQPLHFLERARRHYPLSLHGVGLSLGSTDKLSHEHLNLLKWLIVRIEPAMVSEHLCWGSIGGRHLNDLLPLPYTEEALALVCSHVGETQDFLARQIFVENVSSYLQFTHSTLPEWEFVREVAARTDCGILLDVNNIYVNSINHGFDASRYLRGIPRAVVGEIYLAGFDAGADCLIDTHAKPVADAVWSLYREAVARFGPTPTLIEWDADIPALDVLLAEARKADSSMEARYALAS
ncbi:MAG: MNIO family bufferin maturase [Burkholderiales bacterium]